MCAYLCAPTFVDGGEPSGRTERRDDPVYRDQARPRGGEKGIPLADLFRVTSRGVENFGAAPRESSERYRISWRRQPYENQQVCQDGERPPDAPCARATGRAGCRGHGG